MIVPGNRMREDCATRQFELRGSVSGRPFSIEIFTALLKFMGKAADNYLRFLK